MKYNIIRPNCKHRVSLSSMFLWLFFVYRELLHTTIAITFCQAVYLLVCVMFYLTSPLICDIMGAALAPSFLGRSCARRLAWRPATSCCPCVYSRIHALVTRCFVNYAANSSASCLAGFRLCLVVGGITFFNLRR